MRSAWPGAWPHDPYITAVGATFTADGISPGRMVSLGAAHPGQHATRRGQLRMSAIAALGRGRCTGPVGTSWHWSDDTGWRYALTGPSGRTLLHTIRSVTWLPVYAAPTALAEIAERLTAGRRPGAAGGAGPLEWEGAAQIRQRVDAFRTPFEAGRLRTSSRVVAPRSLGS
ncbi:hypothetical protein [Streptomyces sp. NPDC058371]|uniref:hypothetical protein n=1 Tax=Streptomyces sp. NPDC058371 TaxID=3346463 RepID=UPI00364F73B3